MKRFYLLLCTTLCFMFLYLSGQDVNRNISSIEQAIEENDVEKAEQLIHKNVQELLADGNFDSVLTYIRLKGKIAHRQSPEQAIRSVYQFIDNLRKLSIPPLETVEAYLEAAIFFEDINQVKEAHTATQTALELTKKMKKGKREEIAARCNYNLGVLSLKLGNTNQSKTYHLQALKYRLTPENKNPEDLYFSFNALASIFWYSSHYDSAKYYFNEALIILNTLPQNSLNQYYRPAIVKNNIAAIYNIEGQTSKAIQTMHEAIVNFKTFSESDGLESKRTDALRGWCEAIDNLAACYREIGDFHQAGNLLEYAYLQKKQKLNKDYQGIFISEILLGQHYRLIGSYEKAKKFLDAGLANLEKAEGDYLFWAADAWYTLALLYEETKQPELAARCYEKTEQLYEDAYAGFYDNTYMDFLRNLSLFYAQNKEYKKAVRTSQKVYNYLRQVGSADKLPGFYQLLNLAEINYLSRQYHKAIDYSNSALKLLSKQFLSGNSTLDSVKINLYKPRVILIKSKSTYALQQKKDTVLLTKIFHELDTAVKILESRKLLIDHPQNRNLLMAEQKELIDFFAKISLELFEQTTDSEYLHQFIMLKEAALFGRIRSRLENENARSFSQVPPEVINEENRIKDQIQNALEDGNQNQFGQYLNAVNKWDIFLEKIKKQHPKYYQLRYATLFRPMSSLQEVIPEKTTVIRYYTVDTQLTAIVADKKHTQLIRLDNLGLEGKIKLFLGQRLKEKEQLGILHDIYDQIWAPLKGHVHSKKIIIIPDGILYNINLETLPFEPIDHFHQLYDKSLLSKYSFTYNYSLFMLENQEQPALMKSNYVAFAPGFSDNLKKSYINSVEDSMDMDLNYLKLLPQPTNGKITKKIQDRIGGSLYLNNASTKSNFKENSGDNKIIHLATHARYNNNYPEQSGLYFAKDPKNEEDNFLSLKEIYDCTFRSNLMVLTACESGRPGYNDGEGLASLANAVNYSGSRNILTALWEIDEQSSALITENFFYNIEEGLSLDEALRQAKLTYLKQNEGRILAPAYWSGLILLGMPETLQLNDHGYPDNILLVTVGLIFFIAVVLILLNRRRLFKRSAS